jgi:xanthine dehydrogenase accessory factor
MSMSSIPPGRAGRANCQQLRGRRLQSPVMFGIALSVAACLRAGTRVDVAWIVDRHGDEEFDPSEAVAITPGGGRLGSLLSGALDGQLAERAGVQGSHGRLVELDIGPADAAVSGVATAAGISCVLVPGSELPSDLWERLLSREPVCLVSELDGDNIVRTSLYTSESISEAGDGPRRLFERGSSATEVTEQAVITSLWPRSTVVIVGGGAIAESLERLATMLGWHAVLTQDANEAAGLIAALAPLDSVVVFGHDLELTGRALLAALSSEAGYVGAVGPKRLQETRADWLAYRGQTDLSRLTGPAGLPIGARTPQEVALAIAAEIVATQASSSDDSAPAGPGIPQRR